MDLHRRRSVVVILDANGTKVSSRRIENSPFELATAVAEAGPEPAAGWVAVLLATAGLIEVLDERPARVRVI